MKNIFFKSGAGVSSVIILGMVATISMPFILYPYLTQAANFESVASSTNSGDPEETTIITILAPFATAFGDFLIAGIAFNGGNETSITAPSEWTLIERTNGSGSNDDNVGLATYYKIAGLTEPSSYTWDIVNLEGGANDENTEPRAAGGIIRYTGVDANNPIDVKDAVEGNDGLLNAPSVTTINPNETIIVFYVQDNTTSHPTPLNTTERYDIANPDDNGDKGPEISAADFIQVTSGATGIKSIDVGNNRDDWVTQTIALRNGEVTTGNLKITKTTIGGDGTFSFTGDTGTFLIETTDGTGNATINNLVPGKYSLTEISQTGWEKTSNNCVNIEVVAGNIAECAITNTKRASITINKNVVSPEPQVNAEDNHTFKVKLDDGSEFDFSENSPKIYENVVPGTHTILEITGDPDFDLLSISNDNDQDASNGATFEVQNGQDVIITITNKQKIAHITVNKVVDNSREFGMADANDFSFKINDGSGIAFIAQEGSLIGQNVIDVNPGTYTITELDSLGYVAEYSNCANIVIKSNQSAVCTITNYDLEPGIGNITVIKVVTGGEESPSSFQIHVKQNGTDIVGSPQAGQANAGTTYINMATGIYAISESGGPTGYVASFSGDCNASGVVILSNNETAICTITNTNVGDGDGIDDQIDNCPAVFNPDQNNTDGDSTGNACDNDDDNDGQTDADETSCGSNPLDVESESLDTDSDNIPNCVDPDDDNDTIADGVADPDGEGPIVAGPDNCPVNANTDQADTDLDGIGNVCDSTPNGNAETQGKITVTKVVVNDNGGTKTVSDFPLFVNTTAVVSGTQTNFDPGTYTVSETSQSGYTSVISQDCAANGSITLAAGDVKSCTITNDDIAVSSGGGGGGGGGGSGSIIPTLIIIESSIQVTNVTETSMTLTWETNLPASSYVVYSQENEANPLNISDSAGTPPKYGYTNATTETDISPNVISHSVTVTGLTASTTYYFRLVSRGSLAYSGEYKITAAGVAGVSTVNVTPVNPAPPSNTPVFNPTPLTDGEIGNYNNEPDLGQSGAGQEEPADENIPEVITESESTNPDQLAALGETSALGTLLDWIRANFPWLLLLLLIILVIYYYYKKMKKNPAK